MVAAIFVGCWPMSAPARSHSRRLLSEDQRAQVWHLARGSQPGGYHRGGYGLLAPIIILFVCDAIRAITAGIAL
jgi:hypothetical protein